MNVGFYNHVIRIWPIQRFINKGILEVGIIYQMNQGPKSPILINNPNSTLFPYNCEIFTYYVILQ